MGAKFDNLASNGIIDFDANAYIYNGKSKAAAESEDVGLPFDRPLMASPNVPSMLPGVSMHKQPERDRFGHEKKMTPMQALTGVLVAGLVILGGIKFGPKIKDFFEGISNKISQKKTEIKKNKAAATTAKKAEAAKKAAADAKMAKTLKAGKKAEKAAKAANGWKIGEQIAKLPKGVRIGGGIAVGAGALYGLFKLFSKKEPKQ